MLAFVNAVLSQKKYEGCSNNSRSALVVPAAASDTPVEYKQRMQAERIMEVPAAVPAAAVPAAAATAAEAIAAATAAKPAAAAIVIVLGTKPSVAKAAAAAIVKVPKSVSISALWALAEQGAWGPKTRPGRSELLWA